MENIGGWIFGGCLLLLCVFVGLAGYEQSKYPIQVAHGEVKSIFGEQDNCLVIFEYIDSSYDGVVKRKEHKSQYLCEELRQHQGDYCTVYNPVETRQISMVQSGETKGAYLECQSKQGI